MNSFTHTPHVLLVEMSAKLVALATIGLGAMTVGSVYLVGSSGGMPTCRFLNSDSNATTTYANNAYAKNYLKYLVGVTKPTDHQEDSNDLWWEWVFANRYQANKSSFTEGFANLTSGSTGESSIKKKCENAYKGTVDGGQIKYPTSGTSINYKEEQFWKLCSPSNKKILTIKEGANPNPNSGENLYGKKHEEQLVYEKDNDWFWDFQQQEYDKQEQNQKNLKTLPIRKWCEEAYKIDSTQTQNTDPTVTATTVFKWCSLTGTQPTTG